MTESVLSRTCPTALDSWFNAKVRKNYAKYTTSKICRASNQLLVVKADTSLLGWHRDAVPLDLGTHHHHNHVQAKKGQHRDTVNKLLSTSTLGERKDPFHLLKAKNGGYKRITQRDWVFMRKELALCSLTVSLLSHGTQGLSHAINGDGISEKIFKELNTCPLKSQGTCKHRNKFSSGDRRRQNVLLKSHLSEH